MDGGSRKVQINHEQGMTSILLSLTQASDPILMKELADPDEQENPI